MPTYDYECDACGHKFEHFQSISDPLLRKCPKCKKSKLRRLFGSGAAIVFKGSGFYTTDYRSDSYKKAASADSNSSSSAGSSSSGDSKPASSDKGSGDKGSKSESAKPTKSSGKKKSKSDN